MFLRMISTAIGVPLFLVLCLWGATPFIVGILAMAALGLAEMVTTYRAQGLRPNLLLAVPGLLGPAWPLLDSSPAPPIMLCLAILLLAFVWRGARSVRTRGTPTAQNLVYGLLCGLYVFLFGGLTWLRAWPGEWETLVFGPQRAGASVVLLTAFCVWAADTLAFFVGRALGRHKLAPTLSPSKTWEGAIGGLVGSLAVGTLCGPWLVHSTALGLLIGVIAGVVGPFGDLFESALKREAGVKDFGGFFPGHGGVLDRFDSLLFVAPVVALLLASLCPVL